MDATRCRICSKPSLTSPELEARGVCAECALLPGFFRLPRMARAVKPCGECGGRELVRALAFERGAAGSDNVTAYAAPLSVAFRQSRQSSWWSGPSVQVAAADVAKQIGWLELLICRACGLVTWHALDPEKIPIGPEFGTELVRIDDDGGPYR